MGLAETDEDAKLMLRLRESGDRRAFEELYRRFTPPLVSFLARMVRSRARAEELAQDVFVRIYQARDRYEPRARFSTYLFGIATNLALNELDRAHRRHERSMEAEGMPEDFGADGPGLDEQLEAKLTGERLDSALAALPDRQRAALLLRTTEGLGYGEIAAALDTSVSSVKSLLHRARTELGERLAGVAP